MKRMEDAPNDGLVRYAHLSLPQTSELKLMWPYSVSSSQWGEYMGTIEGVSHLDLINWTNRLKWWLRELTVGTHQWAILRLRK
jgi:hypothetical protein